MGVLAAHLGRDLARRSGTRSVTGGWVRFDADWFERDAVEQLGADVVLFHASALAYSCRQMSDGELLHRSLRKLWPVEDPQAAVASLIDAGFWTETETGWLLVDWSAHLMAADEVQKRREQTRIRVERSRRHKAGDHSMCLRWCPEIKRRNALLDAQQDASVTIPGTDRTGPGRSGDGPGTDKRAALEAELATFPDDAVAAALEHVTTEPQRQPPLTVPILAAVLDELHHARGQTDAPDREVRGGQAALVEIQALEVQAEREVDAG